MRRRTTPAIQNRRVEEEQSSPLAKELIARKRERATLEALEDLVRYLRTIREERKAILTVTEGWLLYGENPSLMRLRTNPLTGIQEPIPGVDPVGVGLNGKLTTRQERNMSEGALTQNECETDRMRLASMDNKRFFLDLMEDANYANASFYPIDPRGLPAFDNPIGPDAPPPITVDHAMLKARIEVMRTLAGNTDGIAVVNGNDLDKGMKRISDDLTSYYLLGYYSTNAKLDGQFQVAEGQGQGPRRRGSRATRLQSGNRSRGHHRAPRGRRSSARGHASGQRCNRQAGARPARCAVPNQRDCGCGRQADDLGRGRTAVRRRTARRLRSRWNGRYPGHRRLDINDRASDLKPGERTFLATVPFSPARRGRSASGHASRALREAPFRSRTCCRSRPASSGLQPLLFRRGVTTGNRVLPAADLRFSRTERVRLELPVDGDVKAGSGRLLDRAGQPMPLPVTVAERLDDATGQRWITADLVLAPLAGGDYAIEIEVVGAGKTQKVVSAIRVVR